MKSEWRQLLPLESIRRKSIRRDITTWSIKLMLRFMRYQFRCIVNHSDFNQLVIGTSIEWSVVTTSVLICVLTKYFFPGNIQAEIQNEVSFTLCCFVCDEWVLNENIVIISIFTYKIWLNRLQLMVWLDILWLVKSKA